MIQSGSCLKLCLCGVCGVRETFEPLGRPTRRVFGSRGIDSKWCLLCECPIRLPLFAFK